MQTNFIFSSETAEDRKEIFSAYIKAWGATGTPKHNKEVEVKKEGRTLYTFRYTDLAGILEAIKKPFAEAGLAVMQNAFTSRNSNGQDEINVETMFLHTSGHWMKTEKITFLAQRSMQDLGGQITYMKRYSLSAALGMATEADDDAAGSSGHQSESKDLNGSQAPKNQNKGQQNQQKQQGGYGSPDDVRKDPQPAGPEKLSDGQRKAIHAKLKSIGESQNTEKDKVYPRIQEIYNTNTPIDELSKQGASGLIKILTEFEAGKALWG